MHHIKKQCRARYRPPSHFSSVAKTALNVVVRGARSRIEANMSKESTNLVMQSGQLKVWKIWIFFQFRFSLG